jgi:hypothetical protein
MRESRTSGSVRAKAEWLSYSTNQLNLLVFPTVGLKSVPQTHIRLQAEPKLACLR